MAFCSKCGAHIPDGAQFCSNCGQVQNGENDVTKNKVISIFSYIGIFFLIPLLGAKESRFAQFHAKQGLALFIAEICCWIISAIVSALTAALWFLWPITIILRLVSGLISILPVPFMIIGIINVVHGQEKELPILGKFVK